MAKESFKVILKVETECHYIIDEANSEEEALIIAEQSLLEGDEGEMENQEVVAWDVFKVEEGVSVED